MQLEINLVTKSAMNANVRAAVGMEAVKLVKTDKAYVEGLEAKVTALQEWAVASATAKEIIAQRNNDLERRLRKLMENIKGEANLEMKEQLKQQRCDGFGLVDDIAIDDGVFTSSSIERKLWNKRSSIVVAAG